MTLLTNVIEDIAELALPMDIVRISEADFKRLEQQTNNTDQYLQQLDKLKSLFHTFEKVYVTENVQFTSNPYRTELFIEPNFYRNTVSATYSTQISDTSRITITKNYTDLKLGQVLKMNKKHTSSSSKICSYNKRLIQ